MVDSSSPKDCSHAKGSPSSSQHWLPPCRVCGEAASGLHYGVNTCEACKGFFRRSLQRKEKYRCTGNGDCPIGQGQRGSCAFCRYQKCVAEGMSKQAIKTGRYTHAKKTRDIVEVKRLRLDQDVFVSSDHRNKDMEDVIDKISELDKIVNRFPEDFENEISNVQADYMEDFRRRQELFGNMEPMSKEEYRSFYASTGIDVDGRKDMVQRFSTELCVWIERFIQFAKGLPGFRSLTIDEQASVIKASRFEVWFLCSYIGISLEHDIFTTFRGKTLHLNEMKRICDEEYLALLFKAGRRLKLLQLAPKERALLKAAVILMIDRVEVKNSLPAENGLALIIRGLEYLLQQNHKDDKLMLAKVLGTLPLLRQLSHWNLKVFSTLHLDFPHVNFHPLFYEMLSM